MTKHARFAPSAASRWLHCPGSVSLSEAIGAAGATGEESEYAQEGVRAHQLAAQALSFALDGVDMLYADDVPEEMQTAIALYVSTVMAAVKPGDKVEIEKQYAIDDDLWGTTDAVVFHAADHTAEVFDFKYGVGVVVEAEDNPQGGIYLAAVGHETSYQGRRFTIVQPRAAHKEGPVRSWAPHPAELRSLLLAAKAAMSKGRRVPPPLAAGEWCQFCPARGHCPELNRHAQLVAATDFDVVEKPAEQLQAAIAALPIQSVVAALEKAPILELWIKAARDRIYNELSAGRSVPGYKLVAKKPRRQWNSVEELERWAAASGLTDVDLYTMELKSPAQLEDVIGKKNLPEALYTLVSSGATIAPATDSRPALASAAGEDFPALPPGSAAEQVT
jgi:Protein of unknown function (DUF2800)